MIHCSRYDSMFKREAVIKHHMMIHEARKKGSKVQHFLLYLPFSQLHHHSTSSGCRAPWKNSLTKYRVEPGYVTSRSIGRIE